MSLTVEMSRSQKTDLTSFLDRSQVVSEPTSPPIGFIGDPVKRLVRPLSSHVFHAAIRGCS